MLVIIITAFGSVDTAVDAMKNGAFDYVTKPFNRDELRLTIEKAFQMSRLSNENLRLHQQLVERFSFSNIIGGSKKMQELFEMAGRVAQTDSTVLISGESGTGKELIARAIHFNSKRRDKNFVAVNCSSIPETLLESELFGYIKGAFTGAVKDKEGKFEFADGGTLFLDEVRDLPIELQPKLLRVLQEKEIDKIGGSRPVKIDARIIAATNRSLEDAVKSGEFREDLYYRLSVVPLTVPPLREPRV
jgi:two-component system NtrC family response regulator